MQAEYVGQHAGVFPNGHLYLRRDLKVTEDSGRVRYFSQHAVVREVWHSAGPQIDRLIWVGHPEGGVMEPLIQNYAAAA